MSSANLKCISWSAVSSRPQVDGESLTDQSNKNKSLIATLNGQCVADLVVPGESREILDLDTASAKIPAYAQLSAIIRNRDADLLVCQDLSRLGREASLIIQIVRLCQRNQIALYARSSPPSTLDARKQETDIAASLMLALESAMVRVEMINLRKRHDIGTRGRAKRGLFANKIPYGYLRKYRADGSEYYEIDPQPAQAIRYIYERYLHYGDSIETIADNLTRMGIPRPDGQTQWGKQSVRLLIWNADRYAGWAEINKRGDREYVRARGIWQPIIDEATAEAVHAEYQKRHAYRRGHTVNDYLYRGRFAHPAQPPCAPIRRQPAKGQSLRITYAATLIAHPATTLLKTT